MFTFVNYLCKDEFLAICDWINLENMKYVNIFDLIFIYLCSLCQNILWAWSISSTQLIAEIAFLHHNI